MKPWILAMVLILGSGWGDALVVSEQALAESKENAHVTNETSLVPFYSYHLNTLIGMVLANGVGTTLGAQLAFAPMPRHEFYLGPEVSYALYGTGSLLQALVGGYTQCALDSSHQTHAGVGFLAGAAFTSQLCPCPGTALAGYVDFFLAQRLSPGTDVRIQIRPGLIYNLFAMMLNLNISFQFL